MNDTIAAISTSLGVGAISIIRVSGDEAITIVNNLTKSKKILNKKSHTINYDFIVDEDKIIDEVLISVMHAPKTFTKENIIEINCHGGIAPTNKILELLLTHGCRLSEPGEFSKRAFLNGRIDLLEAEGIMDLINSKTEKAMNLSINQVNGNVSKLITNLRQKLVEIIANIEVNIDYPEYEDIEQMTIDKLNINLKYIENEITTILEKSKNGKIIKEGIKVALIGRPNVGKSSLLNCLIDENKAIVTAIAGTTRDCVEGTLNLNGVILNIIDTAGIRETNDLVEKLGVDKSKNIIKSSELVLLLLNNNEILSKEDIKLIEEIKNKNHIIVVNKNDLESKLDINKIDSKNIVYISVIENTGIEELKNMIKRLFNLEQIETDDYNYLSNARAISLLKHSLISIQDIKTGIINEMPIDMIEIDLKNVWNLLGKIIGQSYEEELINQLFSQFCLGK